MLATTLLLTLLASTPQDTALTAEVRSLLGAIDRVVPAATWRGLGPEAISVLNAIATSTTELPHYRARAVEALSVIGGDEAIATARALSRAPGERWDVRASAVRGLGRLLPEAALVAELTPMLDREPQVHVREAAAAVLARRAGPAGCDAVRAQARKEARPGRAPYARALARCDAGR